MTPATVASRAPLRARRRPGWTLVAPVGGFAYLALVFGPLAALAGIVATSLPTVADAARSALEAERLTLLARSAVLACGAGVGGMAIGILVATVLSRWRTGPLSRARWLVLALAPVPPYVHALSWSSTAHAVGARLGARGVEVPVTFGGAWASLWVQTMALLPLAVGIALLALESVPDEVVDAARLTAPDGAVLRRIVVPLAAPALLAGAGILFVLSLLDYSVPTLYQVNVYALAVFAAFSVGNDPAVAVGMSAPLVASAALVVYGTQSGIRRVAQRAARARPPSGAVWRWSAPFRLARALACGVLAAQVLVPLVNLTTAVGSPAVLLGTLGAAREDVMLSLAVAVAAAAVCLPAALAAAALLDGGGASSRGWWLAVTLPLAVPAPLVGIGLAAAWNRAALPLYGTTAMPVLAAAARFAPMAAIVLLAHLRRIDPGLVDAARVHQSGTPHGWAAVRVPLLLPGLVAAACVTFALALGELGATLIVVPPGRQTLTLRIFNYLHYGGSDTVAGLCLAMVGVSVLAGVLAVAAVTVRARRLDAVPADGGAA